MATEHALSTSPLATLFEKVETILVMSAQVPAKIVLKSTTKMSLNDRFTNIALTRPPPTVTMIRTGLMEEHQAMVANQRFQQQMVNRPGLQALTAANRGKKSLQQRLGRPNVKARLNLNLVNQGSGGPMVRGRGNRRPARGIRGGMVQRGGTNTFMPRGGQGQGQGRGRGQGQMMKMSSPMNQPRNNFNNPGQMQSGGRMRGRGRGFRGSGFRGSRGGFVARGQDGEGRRSFPRRRGGAGQGGGYNSESWRGGSQEWNYRGGRGAPRGGRGFRGGGRPGARGRGGRGAGRGRGAGGNVSREDLDTQLDEYMAKTRTQLDAELDTYMQQSS